MTLEVRNAQIFLGNIFDRDIGQLANNLTFIIDLRVISYALLFRYLTAILIIVVPISELIASIPDLLAPLLSILIFSGFPFSLIALRRKHLAA